MTLMPGTGVWNFNAPRNVNTSDPVVLVMLLNDTPLNVNTQ